MHVSNDKYIIFDVNLTRKDVMLLFNIENFFSKETYYVSNLNDSNTKLFVKFDFLSYNLNKYLMEEYLKENSVTVNFFIIYFNGNYINAEFFEEFLQEFEEQEIFIFIFIVLSEKLHLIKKNHFYLFMLYYKLVLSIKCLQFIKQLLN